MLNGGNDVQDEGDEAKTSGKGQHDGQGLAELAVDHDTGPECQVVQRQVVAPDIRGARVETSDLCEPARPPEPKSEASNHICASLARRPR